MSSVQATNLSLWCKAPFLCHFYLSALVADVNCVESGLDLLAYVVKYDVIQALCGGGIIALTPLLARFPFRCKESSVFHSGWGTVQEKLKN